MQLFSLPRHDLYQIHLIAMSVAVQATADTRAQQKKVPEMHMLDDKGCRHNGSSQLVLVSGRSRRKEMSALVLDILRADSASLDLRRFWEVAG